MLRQTNTFFYLQIFFKIDKFPIKRTSEKKFRCSGPNGWFHYSDTWLSQDLNQISEFSQIKKYKFFWISRMRKIRVGM